MLLGLLDIYALILLHESPPYAIPGFLPPPTPFKSCLQSFPQVAKSLDFTHDGFTSVFGNRNHISLTLYMFHGTIYKFM